MISNDAELRRRAAIRSVRVRWWCSFSKKSLGISSTVELQQRLEPELGRTNAESREKNSSRYFGYARGAWVPHKRVVAKAEREAPGSERLLNHVVWKAVLHGPMLKQRQAEKWIAEIDFEVRTKVLDARGFIRVEPGYRYLASLERRASLDALAALVIVIKLAHSRGLDEYVSVQMYSLLRMLFILGADPAIYDLRNDLFGLFVENVFPLAFVEQHERMYFDTYNFDFLSNLLKVLTIQRSQMLGPDYKESRVESMMRILRGESTSQFKLLFEPLIVPNLSLGPPTQQSLERSRVSKQRREDIVPEWPW